MVALFRIVEPCGGGITIDGVDALKIGLEELREAISIIPQVKKATTSRTKMLHVGGGKYVDVENIQSVL